MARDETQPAPDLQPNAGLVQRLHLFAGTWLVNLVNVARPKLTLGVRVAAFDARGRVFLVRHSYVPGFYLPGGGVELGESCREAVVREAVEEAGLAFEGPPELFNIYRNDRSGRRDHVVLFVAREAVASGVASAPPGEILEAGFFDPAALPADTTRATAARLREISGEAVVPDIW
jgi:ADP-ribose pyrophosphatase YjhB (NUDIX family)